jgi:hypothetical protein
MKYDNKGILTDNQTNERTKRLNEAYKELVHMGRANKHEDVARAMGATRPSVSAALSGNAKFATQSFIRRFAMAYSDLFSLDWLLTGSGSMLKGATVPAASAAAPPPPSPSSAPTSQDALIAELRQHIEELRQRIADKEEIIRAKDALILELRRNYSTCYRLDMVAENQ